MSELFDDEPGDVDTRRPGGRARALVITGVVLILAFFALTTFASIYTDRLWYQEVGYSQVFNTMLWTRVGLFLVFGILMGAAVAANMYLAYRFRPLFRLPGGDGSVDRYRDAVTPIRSWLLAGVSIVVGIFAGTSALGHWRTYLLWRHGNAFGQTDAYFHKDIGFYVFDLPWWHFLVDFVMAATVVAVLATAVVHYLYGGIRLQVQHDRLSGAAQVQLSALLGVFVLAKGVDYYLDRFDLVTNDNSLFTGMNYTGENALLPARNILMGVAVICAILFFLNIWRRTWQLPSVGLALLVLSSILLGMIWPAIVQNFQVNPTEADKEESYIQANIDATRDAYDISADTVEPQNYAGVPEGSSNKEPTDQKQQSSYDQLFAQLQQVPLIDPKQVRQTFEQRQQLFAYYSVAPVLDVDRYTLDGKDEPLVLGVRELDQNGINADDKNWSNLHTVYTHGEGVIAAYANRIATKDTGTNGKVVWAEGIQSTDAITKTGDFEQRIYYGEQSPTYSIVGKASADDPDVELGLTLPSGATSEDQASENKTTYDGSGGVKIGSTFRQLMYAVKFGEPNFLLSGRVNGDSKVLYNRDPQQRVEKVAPWLTVDSDPYPAVIDGRIEWILDGYTTTDRYPNSQRESFESMIDDSLQENTGLQTIPTDEINYMRSAVKATVDAYDGTVTLYAWDEDDPILKTWMDVFPDSVKPKSAISDDLMAHLRYPEDLFKVQRYQLAKYHVTDASDFYQGSARWEVAKDPNLTNTSQPPFRVFTPSVDSSTGSEWSLTSVFTPRQKDTVASFAYVNSDATDENDFGKIHLLEFNDPNAPAPGQVANSMSQDDDVRAELLPYTNSGTPPIFGNLLTLPVNDGLIYIEPVYAIKSGGDSSYPILQFVLLSYNGNVGIGGNLSEALADSLGIDLGATPTDNPPGDNTNPPGDNNPPGDHNGTSLKDQIAEELTAADDAFTKADDAKANGNFTKWAKFIKDAQDHFETAVGLIAERDSRTAKGSKGGS